MKEALKFITLCSLLLISGGILPAFATPADILAGSPAMRSRGGGTVILDPYACKPFRDDWTNTSISISTFGMLLTFPGPVYESLPNNVQSNLVLYATDPATGAYLGHSDPLNFIYWEGLYEYDSSSDFVIESPNAYQFLSNVCAPHGFGSIVWTSFDIHLGVLNGGTEPIHYFDLYPPKPNTSLNSLTMSYSFRVCCGGVRPGPGPHPDPLPNPHPDLDDSDALSILEAAPEGAQRLIAPQKEKSSEITTAKPLVVPNPVADGANLVFDLPDQHDVSITLSGMDGKILQLYEQVLPAGTHQQRLDFTNLPAGLYICKLETEKEIHLLKVLKTK